jgi:hypothetical protein
MAGGEHDRVGLEEVEAQLGSDHLTLICVAFTWTPFPE